MRSIKHGILALAFCVIALGVAPFAQAADEFKGTWTIERSQQVGMVHLGLRHRTEHNNSNFEMDQPASDFTGLDLAAPGKRDARFALVRDAGRLDCEGYVNDGEGAGTFRFTPDKNFAASIKAIGFGGADGPKQFAMALHDVSLSFAREMKAENLEDLDTDKLLSFRIFNVDSRFIRDMRAAGVPAKSADRLIAFRVHGVTPEFVQKVAKLGFEQANADQLVAMRVHGVTPEYIANLKSRGVKDLTIDKLINLRIHGIE